MGADAFEGFSVRVLEWFAHAIFVEKGFSPTWLLGFELDRSEVDFGAVGLDDSGVDPGDVISTVGAVGVND